MLFDLVVVKLFQTIWHAHKVTKAFLFQSKCAYDVRCKGTAGIVVFIGGVHCTCTCSSKPAEPSIFSNLSFTCNNPG